MVSRGWSGSTRIRSEEHTSELSHLVISYAVFCLKKKKSAGTSGSDGSAIARQKSSNTKTHRCQAQRSLVSVQVRVKAGQPFADPGLHVLLFRVPPRADYPVLLLAALVQ